MSGAITPRKENPAADEITDIDVTLGRSVIGGGDLLFATLPLAPGKRFTWPTFDIQNKELKWENAEVQGQEIISTINGATEILRSIVSATMPGVLKSELGIRSMSPHEKIRGKRIICATLMLLLYMCSACDTSTDADHSTAGGLNRDNQTLGLVFSHASGIGGDYAVPEIIGSGGALIDFDDDGDMDVLLINSDVDRNATDQGATHKSSVRLYRNDNGSFQDITAIAGFADTGFGMGAAIGDIDNDGDRDIFVTHYGSDRLYRNNGDGTFSDISTDAGIAGDSWSSSAMFFDFDLDGWLDLFVVGYLAFDPNQRCSDQSGRREYCGPKSFSGVSNTLYRNLGLGPAENSRFANVSAASGIGTPTGKSMGVLAHDFSNDGLPDIYVANDGEKNELWINQGPGDEWRFVDQAVIAGVAYNLFGKPEASMGLQIGDVDDDGLFDLFVTHLSDETNTLYLGLKTGFMRDATVTSGLGPASMPHTGFGSALSDMDLDGDLDLLIVNGRVTRNPVQDDPAKENPAIEDNISRYHALYGEPNQYYRNDAGHFTLACDETPEFCRPRLVDRALLAGDIDADGDTDIFVIVSNGAMRFYRNNMPRQGNWLRIRAMLAGLNRDAIGATITIRSGDKSWMRAVTHTGSYMSGIEAWAHFGVGQSEQIDTIEIAWPDGTREIFAPVAVNQSITLNKGTGTIRQ